MSVKVVFVRMGVCVSISLDIMNVSVFLGFTEIIVKILMDSYFLLLFLNFSLLLIFFSF